MYLNMPTQPLSTREKQISMLCAQGYSNREIADKVFISENTVKFHLKQIFRKLDIRKRNELIVVFNKKLPERVGD
ncbi:hypothetical protein GCM10009092_23000 [Bowmanella denitrificans]|uniref:HTH luxR-type domain-containing protein n=1 Tax=Bowmanella denitrificans TaxID=366582 RepID=A0ABP3GZD8_9ALTE